MNHREPKVEEMLNDLIQGVFGFSFARWHALNLWKEEYVSHSVVENGRMLANVCTYEMNLTVDGKHVRAYQVGAVATRKECRGRGLSRLLMERACDRAGHSPMFLFVNETVVGFYPLFGFRRVYESVPRASCAPSAAASSAIKLAREDERVDRFLGNGRACSNLLDVRGASPIAHFHLLMDYPDAIFFLPELDALCVAETHGDELYIAYLNAPACTRLPDVLAALPFPGFRRVRFGFMPDILGIGCEWERLDGDDDAVFVRGNLELPEPFAFPALFKT